MVPGFRRLALACVCAAPVSAQPLTCPTVPVTVQGGDRALAERVCRDLQVMQDRFTACELGAPPPLEVAIVESLPPHCLGLFHCDEDRIEVISPGAMSQIRNAQSAFADLSDETLFTSILQHEYAHALFEGTPCPFEHCLATSEYFAYSQQIAALPPSDQATITARIDPDVRSHSNSVSVVMLYFAPEIFITSVWAHFSARPNACGTWRALLSGDLVFDRERQR